MDDKRTKKQLLEELESLNQQLATEKSAAAQLEIVVEERDTARTEAAETRATREREALAAGEWERRAKNAEELTDQLRHQELEARDAKNYTEAALHASVRDRSFRTWLQTAVIVLLVIGLALSISEHKKFNRLMNAHSSFVPEVLDPILKAAKDGRLDYSREQIDAMNLSRQQQEIIEAVKRNGVRPVYMPMWKLRMRSATKCWVIATPPVLGLHGAYVQKDQETSIAVSSGESIHVRDGCPAAMRFWVNDKEVFPKNENTHVPPIVEVVTITSETK
jgi:hypothetical protein